MTTPAVLLSHITAGYGGAPIVRDVDLTVPEGACWAIVGPSGGGKTTLLRVIAGLIEPERGQVNRADANGANGDGRSAVGYIPQNLGLVRNATARENVLLGALGRLSWWRSLLGLYPAEERRMADEALARVGLAGRGGDRVDQMSGGERRRVVIARALLQRPKLLLADEFLAEVDHVTAEEILDLFRTLRTENGMTVIFVDHHIEMACRLADRVVIMVDGAKSRELSPTEAAQASLETLFRPAPA